MKGIKTILGAFAAATMLFVSFGAYAQENANRDENNKVVRGPYETNRFGDNWFIGIGGGINSYLAKDAYGKIGIAVDANFGKWFTPTIGARLGYRGITNTKVNAIDNTDQLTKWMPHNAHLDLLWNMSNSFGGYKETRFWDIIPYVSMATLIHCYDAASGDKIKNWEFGAGLGFLNDFRLGKHVDLFLDLSALAVRSQALTVGEGWIKDRVAVLPTATLGLIFNLGKSNWDRHSSITPVVIPVPFTLDQYNALKDRVDALEKENAELKDKIAALEEENAKYKNLKDGQTYLYKDGEFIETEAKTISTPAIVYFDIDKAKLSQRELAHLEYYAQSLDENSEIKLVGSCDSKTGTAEYNQKLSEKRVDYVKDLLVNKYNVKEENIEAVAEGSSNNLFDTPAKNRCVTLKVK